MDSYGPEAVDLARLAGLNLDPWQCEALTHWMAVRPDGKWACFEAAEIVARQNGKALDVDTPMLTTAGWLSMAELRAGDEVFHPNGHPTRVVAAFDVLRDRPCYRVATTDGRSVVADAEHLWTVTDVRCRPRSWETLTTEQLVERGLMRSRREFAYRLPVQQAVVSKPVDLPIDPYLFGAWLGDGNSVHAALTVGEQDREGVIALIKDTGARVVSVRPDRQCWTVRFNTGAMRDGFESRCRMLGVWGNKHVPEIYLAAGTEQRHALLQGLLDTDGSIDKARGQVEFCSTRRSLADAVLYLARSLGWRATVRESSATLDGREVSRRWRVCFTPVSGDPPPFRLHRKTQRVRASNARGGEVHAVSIRSVERVESRPVRCIRVDSPDGLFLAGRDLVPTHNTVLLAARALAGLFLLNERLVMWSSHEYKDLDVETPILTSAGWSTLGALTDGDEVYAPDGQATKVLAAHPVLHDSECYRVGFADGQSLVAGAGHLWAVTEVGRSGATQRRVVTTDTIRRAGLVHHQPTRDRARNVYRWRVDLPQPLVRPLAALPIDPYLLGVWLGDGDTGDGRITVGRDHLPHLLGELGRLGERYRATLDPRTHGRVYTVRVYGLRMRLQAEGLLGGKHIPSVYLTASVEQRRALLAGIMDSDGGVCGHQIVVTMIKRDLMADVASLIRSLGYRATERVYRAKLNGSDAGPMYRVQFAPTEVSPFRLPQKTAKISHHRKTRSAYNAIVSVERVPTRPTRCITVAHESGSYVVGRGFIPTHNTAMEGFRYVRELIGRLVDDGVVAPLKISNTNGEEAFERLDTGQRLKFFARSKSSGRGFTGNVNLVDEAFAFSEIQQSALMPTLLAVPNGQIIYTSSPPLDGESGGPLYDLRARGEAGDDRLCWRDWGLDGDLDDLSGVDTLDKRLWAQTNPALGDRITLERIEALRRSMGTQHFAREVLGVWPRRVTRGGGVIDMKLWAQYADEDSAPLGAVVFAVDASPNRASAAIASSGLREDELYHVKIMDHRSGTGWVVDRVVDLVKKFSPPAVIIDPSGPAGSMVPELMKRDVPVVEVSGRELAQACGSFYDDVVNGRLRHVDQETLNAALREASTRHLGEAWTWTRRYSSGDITPLVAATLAVHGMRVHAMSGDPWFVYA